MNFSRELEVPAIPPAEDEANTTYAVEQRPRPNTRVANSSGSSGNQKRSTANTHNGRNRLDQDKTHRWLKAAGLKAETEGLIIAAQDQSLPTRWYQHNRPQEA